MKPLLWDSPNTIQHIESMLHNGEVVLASGDTILGLLADISSIGYAKLDMIKNRSKKPYLLLVENQKKALKFIETNAIKIIQIEKLLNICWPGPATLIFKAKATVPYGVKSLEGNVAIRIPAHIGLLQLLKNFDALYSTSANTSGKSAPVDIAHVEKDIIRAVSAIVLNENQSTSVVPSTIIDCTGSKIKIVREGTFSIEKLKQFLE